MQLDLLRETLVSFARTQGSSLAPSAATHVNMSTPAEAVILALPYLGCFRILKEMSQFSVGQVAQTTSSTSGPSFESGATAKGDLIDFYMQHWLGSFLGKLLSARYPQECLLQYLVILQDSIADGTTVFTHATDFIHAMTWTAFGNLGDLRFMSEKMAARPCPSLASKHKSQQVSCLADEAHIGMFEFSLFHGIGHGIYHSHFTEPLSQNESHDLKSFPRLYSNAVDEGRMLSLLSSVEFHCSLCSEAQVEAAKSGLLHSFFLHSNDDYFKASQLHLDRSFCRLVRTADLKQCIRYLFEYGPQAIVLNMSISGVDEATAAMLNLRWMLHSPDLMERNRDNMMQPFNLLKASCAHFATTLKQKYCTTAFDLSSFLR